MALVAQRSGPAAGPREECGVACRGRGASGAVLNFAHVAERGLEDAPAGAISGADPRPVSLTRFAFPHIGHLRRRHQRRRVRLLLVLRTLGLKPMHGWGLAQRIETMSDDVFAIQQGTLYPALQRMKRKGWLQSEWRLTETGRRARYYFLTDFGRRQFATERAEWERTVNAVNGVLNWAGGRR